MAKSKRENILELLEVRLGSAFPDVPISRGFTGGKVDVFPSIYIFEDTETYSYDRKRRELYRKVLPVQVEYFDKCSKPEQLYPEANVILTRLGTAVDIDEKFGGLCDDFWLTDPEIVPMRESTFDVVLRLFFDYAEQRMGRVS